ncbi:MAG: glycine zipper 2TM domain-containing protein [Chromatiales bacterium]
MQSSKTALRAAALLSVAVMLSCWGTVTEAEPPLPWSRDYDEWLRGERQIDRHYYRQTPPYHPWTGHCNHEQVVGAIGGALGGLIGSRVGEDKGRVATTAAGAFFGYLIGSRIGRSMDESDPACGIGKFERTDRPAMREGAGYQPVMW